MDEWRGLKPEDSYKDWDDDEMWESAIQQAERLDREDDTDSFVWGDLYEDPRI